MKRRFLFYVAMLAFTLSASAQFNPFTTTPQDILNMAANSLRFDSRWYRDDRNRLVFVMSNTVTSDITFALVLGQREYWVTLKRNGTRDGLPYYPVPGTQVGVKFWNREGRNFCEVYYYSEQNKEMTSKSFIDTSIDNQIVSDRPSYCKEHYKYDYPDPYLPFEPAFKALAEAQSRQMATTPPASGGYNGGTNGYNNGTTGSGNSSAAGTHKCGLCGGTGSMIKNDATDLGQTKWCEVCRKRVSQSHYHTTCTSCGGRGSW